MKHIIPITILSLLFFSTTLSAGSYSYDAIYSSDNVVAPVKIKNDGIYNLVISIKFNNTPYDTKIYKSTSYQKLIQRMEVEWGNLALSHLLSAKEQDINELSLLKSRIVDDIQKLSERLKKKYSLGDDVEVVFSLTNFFLVEPRRYVNDR